MKPQNCYVHSESALLFSAYRSQGQDIRTVFRCSSKVSEATQAKSIASYRGSQAAIAAIRMTRIEQVLFKPWFKVA